MRLSLLPVIVLAAAVSAFAPQQPSSTVGAEPGSVQPPAATTVPEAGVGGQSGAAAGASGLPRRAPEPRTMEAQWPMFALLAGSWIGIVAYLLMIGRRSRRIAELVERTGGSA